MNSCAVRKLLGERLENGDKRGDKKDKSLPLKRMLEFVWFLIYDKEVREFDPDS